MPHGPQPNPITPPLPYRTLAGNVQEYLGSAIAAELPAGVSSSVGYPAGGPEAEHVWIEGGFAALLPRRISGGAARDEEATITVRCVATVSGGEFGPARNRALEFAGAVEDVLVSDPTLGGLVAEAHVAEIDGQDAIPDESSRQYGVTLRIAYRATVGRAL